MANGDQATALGWDTVAGTADRRQGYDEINKTRDYAAGVKTEVRPVAKGGTGASDAATARTNLAAAAASHSHRIGDILTADGSQNYGVALQGVLDGMTANTNSKASASSLDSVYQGNMSSGIYNRTVGGNSVYINTSGVLGYLPSASRFKKFIRNADLDPQAARAILIRTYQYKAAVDVGDEQQIGVIAEELEANGFSWLVGYDEAGEPMTVHYDRIGLVALALAQHAEDRCDAIEDRLTKAGL